jgi:hypothetical protein
VRHIRLPTVSAGSSNWTAIGAYPYFTGSYDGGGYTISNLTINRPSNNYQGLFGNINNYPNAIKNVGIVNCDIKGKDCVGGVVGENYSGTVENCYATGNVSGSEGVGGVAGYNNGTVENCYATGNVSGSKGVGGVVGENGSTVKNCYATGNVTGNVSGSEDVGGVAGYNSGTVENCYATGNVSSSGSYVGGVVGLNYEGTVKNCYATGNVSSSGSYVGGVVGDNNRGTVENCYATGNVYGIGSSSYSYIGGVMGYNNYNSNSTVKNCIALNPNITLTGSNIGRVLCNESSSNMTNNYGRADMKKNGAAVTWTNNTNGQDGADITATEWNNASWWTGTATFSMTDWDISNGKLPTLKNMPGNPEQNPVVQPLP